MTVTTDVGQGVSLRYVGPHVGVLTIDSPPANALSGQTRASFERALDHLEADLAVRALVVTTAGKHFTAGAHLREDEALEDHEVVEYIDTFLATLDRVENFRVPVIAAIRGGAIGGGMEFALACDIRVAADDAFFVAAGVNVGLIVSFWRLPRLIGLGPAKEILLTGQRCDATRALRYGLVSDVVAPHELLSAALAKAHRIATRAPLSVEATKAAANMAHDLDFAAARTLQVEKFVEMSRTRDHAEALRAFFDKSDGAYERH